MKTSLAAAAVLTLMSSAALAQTTGVGLSAPGDVQPTGTAGPTTAAPSIGPNPDPFERFNRKSYAFSNKVDRIAIRPGAIFYKRATPRPVRNGLHNMLQNMDEPVVFVNDVLQLRFKSAADTLYRLVGNSTIGLGGIFDVAAHAGVPHHDNGFGLTMGRYGVPAGPYFYLPVLGPTTLRDGVGSGVDGFTDPLNYARFDGQIALQIGRPVVGGLDLRASVDKELKQLQTTATDPYATIRSVYLQNKQAQIGGGDTNLQALPDFPGDPGVPAAGAPRRSRSTWPGAAAPQAAPDTPAYPAPPASAPSRAPTGADPAGPSQPTPSSTGAASTNPT